MKSNSYKKNYFEHRCIPNDKSERSEKYDRMVVNVKCGSVTDCDQCFSSKENCTIEKMYCSQKYRKLSLRRAIASPFFNRFYFYPDSSGSLHIRRGWMVVCCICHLFAIYFTFYLTGYCCFSFHL